MPLCISEGVGVIPWSPLARGFLAGNRKRGDHGATTRERTDAYAHGLYYEESDYVVADRTADVARDKGLAPAQIALAWLLAQPGITAPIVGASRMEHLEQAVNAIEIRLSADERKQLEDPYVPHRTLGH